MSIFRNTFKKEIQDQLDTRQKAINGVFGARSVKEIQYLNSRNSWIRMCSSVNVGNDQGALAKNNVLLGGTLKYESVNNNFVLRQGIDNAGSGSYSTKTITGTDPYRLGIRPMAGITSMDIKSKSAYGSLREATVNFICWDIKQLEDLELLYMRPGYTVLVEWGWLPYLDNNENLVTTLPNFYDILNKERVNRTVIFRELYEKSLNSGGNYDAMFGYVRNYQWSARPDGGYDCQTTIISTGEIIESLKVNYVNPDLVRLNSSQPTGKGFLDAEFSNQGNFPPNRWKEHYEKNKLAGIWAEAYDKLKVVYTNGKSKFNKDGVFQGEFVNESFGVKSSFNNQLPTGSIFQNKFSFLDLPILKSVNNNDPGTIVEDKFQGYITLEAALDTITKYIMPRDGSGNPLMDFSSYTEAYSSPSSDLLCVAHPTQISVDPSVCLIKSPIWYKQGGILYSVQQATSGSAELGLSIANELKAAVKKASNTATIRDGIKDFGTALSKIDDLTIYNVVEKNLGGPESIQNILNDLPPNGIRFVTRNIKEYDTIINELKNILGPNNISTTEGTLGGTTGTIKTLKSIKITVPTSTAAVEAATTITGANQAIANLAVLDSLPQSYFFGEGDEYGYNELGYIKNIFVSLDFLYKKSIDLNIESTDNSGKNEINLYKYIKTIISAIQTSIGNTSNFEIHVDPVDNKARIIDINYTGIKNPSLFKLQVHNTKSVVRSYTLQSQIFPEQSAIIAIGSQAKGGQLGIQNNTMIDFNKNITDRITPEKLFPDGNILKVDATTKLTSVANNLGSIVNLFGNLTNSPSNISPEGTTDVNALFSKAKNNLRDLIVYFQSITDSPGANRNIIPIKFSFTMDGIGGLVIGHLFEINDDILPRGYKGGKTGARLAQTVTGIGHTIGNGDWTTKIDALNIILDSKTGGIPFRELKLQEIIQQSLENAFTPPTTPVKPVVSEAKIASFGSVSTSIPLGARPL